jgi:hypothetical protein
MVLIGGGAGKGPRHIEIASRSPVGNMWSTVAARYGTTIEHFGDGNGPIDGIF